MRTLSPEFAAHIATGQTTLANCWRVERADGMVLGFTDHDRVLAFDGISYSPVGGADAGQVASKLGAATDAAEIIAILDDDAIAEADILLGRFDNAEVQTWRVNWADTDVRHILRRDSIGEITRVDGVFRAELRSAQEQLNQRKGRLYQSLCGTSLGANPCGIDLENPTFKGQGSVVALEGASGVTTTDLSGFASDWFSHGHIVWTSGARSGKKDRVVRHKRTGVNDVLFVDTHIQDWVGSGDSFDVYAGCDRRMATCQAKFSNQTNFRGFPHIPGSDFVLKYPKSGDALSGAALVK